MPKFANLLIKIGLLFLIFAFGAGAASLYYQHQKPANTANTPPKDKYLAFTEEIYGKIQENYWEKVNDEYLVNLYVLATEKLSGQPQNLKAKNKENMDKMIKDVLAQIQDENKKKEYVIQMADMVLANLQPFSRSRLYTQKEEKELSQNVQNISGTDQYGVLGVDKNASSEEIKKTFEQKAEELKKDTSPEAAQKLAQVNKAFDVLKVPEARKVYDETGVETTIGDKLLGQDILYLKTTKVSPTSVADLQRVTDQFNKDGGPTSLILDLRNNIGGSIDILPYLLGPFIGVDQYAYQFYHQGEKTDFKTKIGWLPGLVRYKKVVVLINENTQSSAEVMAATFKKYNVGLVVGTRTKGWGTVEKVFAIDSQLAENEKYSMFLVHSLTLREDGQPIQDKGVEPVIDIKSPNWEKDLYTYLHYEELVKAVKEVLAK